MSTARRMSAQERRDQLLDVLADIVLTEGYPAVSIDRVARDAGIARTVIYSHFGNLEGMLQALIERTEQRALASVRDILPDLDFEEDPDSVLVDALRTFLTVVHDEPQTWRLALYPSEGAPAALREHVDHARRTILALLLPVVERGLQERGGPTGLDPELTARALLTGGEESAKLVLSDPRQFTPERITSFAAALLAALQRR